MPKVKQESEATRKLKAQAQARGRSGGSGGPLWAGPGGEGPQGGVTFSLLKRYLTCKERFRLYATGGLRGADRFCHRMEYGNMWHACEEALAADPQSFEVGATFWDPLTAYCKELVKKYPFQADEVDKWYNVCKVQFPLYVDYWRKHPDMQKREPLVQEQAFDVRYPLPSGRTVRLRGKWDSGDYVTKGPNLGSWIQENKTKGDIDEGALSAQLTFDLQSMIYVAAWETDRTDDTGVLAAAQSKAAPCRKAPVRGVRYNVVRRPLSGGAGNIKQHKPSKKNPAGETKAEYYARLRDVLGDHLNPDGTSRQFMRWEVPVTAEELAAFRRTCLDPLLENLLDDYEWWTHPTCLEIPGQQYNGLNRSKWFPHHTSRHYRHPYGVGNSIDEGYGTDLDEFMRTGTEQGLVRVKTLFRELET